MEGPDLKYRAKRYALKFDPPIIFLEYEDMEANKRVRQVKLQSVQLDVDIDKLTRKVIRSFPSRMDALSVKYDQVRKLVSKLVRHHQEDQRSLSPDDDGSKPHPPPLHSAASPKLPHPPLPFGRQLHQVHANSTDSLSRYSTSTAEEGLLQQSSEVSGSDDDQDSRDTGLGGSSTHGATHNNTFPRNSSFPNSSKTSQDIHTLRNGSSNSNSAGNSRPDRTQSGGSEQQSSSSQSAPAPTTSRSRFAADEGQERLVLDLDFSGDMDLNKVTEVELHMAKVKMETDFLRHSLKPGDALFEYDKQAEFGPATEGNEWDDDDDDEDESGVVMQAQPVVDWAQINQSTSKRA